MSTVRVVAGIGRWPVRHWRYTLVLLLVMAVARQVDAGRLIVVGGRCPGGAGGGVRGVGHRLAALVRAVHCWAVAAVAVAAVGPAGLAGAGS